MNKKFWSVAALVVSTLLVSASASAEGWMRIPLKISASCANYGTLSGSATAAGDTNGGFGTFTTGDTFTFVATGNGAGSWRIVGDPAGSTTYASGGTFPGTLTFRVPLEITATGMGFYVDSHSGTADTISGTCTSTAPAGIPTLSQLSLMILALLLGMFGFVAVLRKRAR